MCLCALGYHRASYCGHKYIHNQLKWGALCNVMAREGDMMGR